MIVLVKVVGTAVAPFQWPTEYYIDNLYVNGEH